MTDARVRLSIGVTAHRDLVPAEEPALRAAVRAFLLDLRARFPALPLRVISALAEGGDQLVAEEALALGVELVVPLPMAQAEYERDFADPAVLARFRALLARAEVRTMPLAPGLTPESIVAPGDARSRQYAQMGMFVSSHCQLLLALWDGHPGSALGGTAQVVDFHIHDAMPDLPIEQVAPNLIADDESDLVFHVACTRRSHPERAPVQPPVSTRWLTQGGASDGGAGMPEAYAKVFQQLAAFNEDAQRHAMDIAAAPSQLFSASMPGTVPPRIAAMERQFHAADWLAVHFQRRVRMSLLATHLIAVLMGLAFILFSDVDASRAWVALFLGLFGVGLVLNKVGERREWQRKYLDYRGLAEGLRVHVYWRIAAVEVPANSSMGYDSFLQRQDPDLSWIRHAMRGTSLLRDESFVADRAWLDWVVAQWIGDDAGRGGQLEYFRRGGSRREHAYRSTTRLGDLALFGGLLGAALLLQGGAWMSERVHQLLLLAMGLLPLIAGVREAYSYKKADRELIKQFRFMARLFESCRARMQRARSDAERRTLLLALGRACLEEHAEWILLHRERPLENAGLG